MKSGALAIRLNATLRAVPVARARGLTKEYGPNRAVAGIDFDVEPGECFGFLGPNGAGKTTTMRMLYGRLRRTSGSLEVLGLDPGRAGRELRARIGVVPQANHLDEELTVIENLVVYAGYFGIPARDAQSRGTDLLRFFHLEHRSGTRTAELSGGMQRRLLVARGLINAPELLILDEPTTALDPQARMAVWQRLADLKHSGVAIALTTHYMEEASRLCDRLVIMDRGMIVATGTPRDLIADHAGSQVLEVRWPVGAAIPALPGQPVRRMERVGDRLLVFTADPARALSQLQGSAETALVRPASLEDVFMHLTGRELDSGAPA